MFVVTVDTEPRSKLNLVLTPCFDCLCTTELLYATTGCQQYGCKTRDEAEMNQTKCEKCGAPCVAGTSFCRQCGAPIDNTPAQVVTDSSQAPSEQTTVLLNQSANVTTQRLESRATGPDRGRLPDPAEVPTQTRGTNRRGIFIGALVIVVIGVICAAALVGIRGHSEASGNLQYPGAKTVFDITGEGGRALHLETSDSFSDVEAWYQKELKPYKTMRLTSNSVVLKNNKTTATIASEGMKTSILIKEAP
jgi:hypothetical protein